MSYADNTLITGETVTYHGRLHWIIFAKPLLVSVIILITVVLLLHVSGLSEKISTETAAIAWLAGLALSAIPIVPPLLTSKSAEFSVTNKRVILKFGFLQSRTEEMFLNKIESVGVDQTLTGRVLGYGDIVIRGTGGSLEPFRRVSRPLEFRRQVQEQIGRSFEPQPEISGRS